MSQMSYNHGKEKLKQELMEKQKEELSSYYNLQPHEINFINNIIYGGMLIGDAYRESHKNTPGYDDNFASSRGATLFRQKKVKKAYEELTAMNLRVSVDSMLSRFMSSIENIGEMADGWDKRINPKNDEPMDLPVDTKTRLNANKYLAETYLKHSEELLKIAKENTNVQVNVNTNGQGNTMVVIGSPEEEQRRVFDGDLADEVYEATILEENEVFEINKEDE